MSDTSGPLASWDIFLGGYRALMQKGDDLKKLKKLAATNRWIISWDLRAELVNKDSVILITDSSQKIIFASSNVLGMTGYNQKELTGKAPRLLHGEQTQPKAKEYISRQLSESKPFETKIINYRKNGTLYNCHIKGYPVFNDGQELVHYIAFEQVA